MFVDGNIAEAALDWWLVAVTMVDMNAMCALASAQAQFADDWKDTSPMYSHPFRPDSKPLISPHEWLTR